MARRYLGMQWAEWQALDARIAELEEDIKAQVKQDESARRLTGIKGVGPLIASAAACLLQAGGPHHLVNAVSRRRVPAGLRHAHRPV